MSAPNAVHSLAFDYMSKFSAKRCRPAHRAIHRCIDVPVVGSNWPDHVTWELLKSETSLRYTRASWAKALH